ncbi:MAG: restriction endonuclease subunit S [Candidatus Gastranaerophilaceae bacterium]
MKAQDLKKSILQYAMQGKLVPQDPNEEPASEVLRKLNIKTLTLESEESYPYELPYNWEWVRLSALCSLDAGKKVSDVSLPLLNARYLRKKIDKVLIDSGFFVKQRDIMILVDGENSGEIFIVPEDGIMGSTFKQLSINSFVNLDFVLHILAFYQDLFRNSKKGAAIPHLDKTLFKNLIIGLPPLKEQKRIVEKLEQIIPLINEYSKNEEKLTEINEKLPTKLRQAILQYAAEGKLVSQNPNDEPASELLKKIESEKEQLIKQDKLKKDKLLELIDDEEIPYIIPKNWHWCRLGSITKIVEYGTSEKAHEKAIGIPILRMNNIQNGKIDYKQLKYVNRNIKDLPRLYLKKNDLLFNRTNSYELVGKMGIFEKESNKYTLASYLIRISLFDNLVNPWYINYYCNSKVFRDTQIEPKIIQQCGQANFNGTKLKSTIIPLPPLEEQKRIVAKVDQLMKLCDELEEQIKNPKLATKILEKISKNLPVELENVIDIVSIIEQRAALSAEIVSQLYNQKRFGAVKNEKILYLCEKHLNLDLGGQYYKMPAGPHDYKARYEVEEIFKTNKWINVVKDNTGNHEKNSYSPDANFKQHKDIFNNCFKNKITEIQSIIDLFKTKTTEKCEIVATLYAVWNDLLIEGTQPTEDIIIQEFKHNWSESKERFYESDLKDELLWMKLKNIIPTGNGSKTLEYVNC